MIAVLSVILVLLFLLTGRKRGVRSLKALAINIGLFFLDIVLLNLYVNAYVVCIITCALMVAVILFYQNGLNLKTSSAALAVMIVIVLLMIVSGIVSNLLQLGSFNEFLIYEEDIAALDVNVRMNFAAISAALLIVAVLGSVIDVAISVTSSTYEIAVNGTEDTHELFRAGKRVGKTVFSTTVNTLFFACIGESLFLIICINDSGYTFGQFINSASFAEIAMPVFLSGIGCILAVPISTFAITFSLELQRNRQQQGLQRNRRENGRQKKK
ncbi:MAG: YibE/F family protein [Eubacterium sp.]|nr:YibE/F family protein [Eubacterium sp.]